MSNKRNTTRRTRIAVIVAAIVVFISCTAESCNPVCLVTKPGDGYVPNQICQR